LNAWIRTTPIIAIWYRDGGGMGKFIVITGLDGTGTSTIAEACAKLDEGSSLFRTPDFPFLIDREVVDATLAAAHVAVRPGEPSLLDVAVVRAVDCVAGLVP
jgi:hypothetical protein